MARELASQDVMTRGEVRRLAFPRSRLSVAFSPIVGNAEHLAVLGRAVAAFAPCRNMVGVHFVEVVDSLFIGVVADGAKGAVRFAFGLGFLRLLAVRGP